MSFIGDQVSANVCAYEIYRAVEIGCAEKCDAAYLNSVEIGGLALGKETSFVPAEVGTNVRAAKVDWSMEYGVGESCACSDSRTLESELASKRARIEREASLECRGLCMKVTDEIARIQPRLMLHHCEIQVDPLRKLSALNTDSSPVHFETQPHDPDPRFSEIIG